MLSMEYGYAIKPKSAQKWKYIKSQLEEALTKQIWEIMSNNSNQYR